MADFFSGLKRHRVARAAAGCAVVAWFLVQLVSNVSPILGLPSWVPQAVLLVIAVAFPIALVVAWALDLQPTETAPKGAPPSIADYVLVGAAAAVILPMSYQGFAPLAAHAGASRGASNLSRRKQLQELEHVHY